MGLYNVVAPCAFLVDGKTVHHTRAGAVVEVDDEQAAELVEAGQLEPHEHVHVTVLEPESEPAADGDDDSGRPEPRRRGGRAAS